MSKTAGQLGEDGIIRIFSSSEPSRSSVLVPNGDDAAAFVVDPQEAVVMTTDSLVEGTHFRFDWSSGRSVGSKLLNVNSSDIAAMGARPRYALLSLCVDPRTSEAMLLEIATGLHQALREHGIALLGGNTTQTSGPMVLSLTLIGTASVGALVSRGKSKPAEALFVTGTLGDARAGLRAIEQLGAERAEMLHAELVKRQREPRARVEVGARLGELGLVSAMCDVSDGLGRDSRRLLGPAGCGAVIDENAVPLSDALLAYTAQSRTEALDLALEGGEDYELLFTAAPEAEERLRQALLPLGVRLSRIGVVSDNPAVSSRNERGDLRPLPHGFAHFD